MRRILALVLMASPAMAESPRQALFPSDGSCYLRHYSGAHLAKNPNQLVSEIALGPDPGSMEADVLILRMLVSIRDYPELLQASAYCENTGGTLSCGIEGDGGWFQIAPSPKGAKVMVGGDGLFFEGGRGFVHIAGGASDDEVFILPPVPADSCP